MRAAADARIGLQTVIEIWTDVKKDVSFFGGCGLLVGLLLALEAAPLRASKPPSVDLRLSAKLFGGFLSLDVFGFLFLIAIIFASVAATLRRGPVQQRLLAAVSHVATRLRQVLSAMGCFTLPLILIALVLANNGDVVAMRFAVAGSALLFSMSLGLYLIRLAIDVDGNTFGSTRVTYVAMLVILLIVLTYVIRVA